MSHPHYRKVIRRLFSTSPSAETVTVALGSNLGNRAHNLHSALAQLRDIGTIQQTSFLYESQPMYITDQPRFLNAALTLTTTQTPQHLLHSLKQIEYTLGRDPNAPKNGPRPIDLDIITYGSQNIRTPTLQIPHPRLAEREFVLRPLCDLSPHLVIGSETVKDKLDTLIEQQHNGGLVKVTPTASGQLLEWGKRTLLMGILNVTPDSFSDGGKFTNVESALQQVSQFDEYKFDVVDIGGQSTRPGSKGISTEEELDRVMGITSAIRQDFPNIMLSIDTYNSKVAKQALAQGVEIVNDVSGGNLDQAMYSTIQTTKAAGILMHMKGTPETMQTQTEYNEDITTAVAKELSQRLGQAQREGIPRWSLIADCGIGFAKTGEQSMELMQNAKELQMKIGNFPTVLGASRKSWMRQVDIRDRDWGTAGVCAMGRWDMVRVHEARVADAVRASDAVRRGDQFASL